MDGLLNKLEVNIQNILGVDAPVIVAEVVVEFLLAVGAAVRSLPNLLVVIPNQRSDVGGVSRGHLVGAHT